MRRVWKEDEMAEDDTNIPESLLPYDQWTEEALRHVVLRAIGHAAQIGLPGGHHFYITFRTDYPGVAIPERLRLQYPEEMTIVLQHQFHALEVDPVAQRFSVNLSFSGIPSTLSIPLAAVSAFADPEVRFGLRFNVEDPEPPEPAQDEPEAPPPRAEPEGPAEIVSLDAFRRRTTPKE